MRVLVIGCGYVGKSLAKVLREAAHEVHTISRRAPEAGDGLGIQHHSIDVTIPEQLASLPPEFDWVVNLVSSSRGGVEDYEKAYFQGTRNILAWLQPSPPKKYVYTSSTSVYGQTDGSLVKENSPATGASPTGEVLLRTEQLLLAAFQKSKFPGIILRVAGIYGPERGHLFHQYLKNEARISGQGERIVNMIHRDDLVSLILRALQSGRPGEIYNAVDDEPVTQLHFFRWLAETLGKWMPPFETDDSGASRKRGNTNKKISNRKIKAELGFACKYPTFRQGYTAEILALMRKCII